MFLLIPFCAFGFLFYFYLFLFLSFLSGYYFDLPFLLFLLFHTSCSSFNISFLLHKIRSCSPLIVCHLKNPAWERLFSVPLFYILFFLSCLSIVSPRISAMRQRAMWRTPELRTTQHWLQIKPPEHKFKGSDIRTRLVQTEFGALPPSHLNCMRLLDVTCGLRGQLTSLFDLHA